MRTVRLATLAGIVAALCLSVAWAQLGEETPKSDSRVEKILKDKDIKYVIDKDGDFKVTFDMGEGRSQLAIIMSNTSEYRNLEIREIWSIGYRSDRDEFPADVANQLLEDTFPKKLGAWAKTGKMAVFMVRLSANADGESLLSALKLALQAADEMEEKLSGDTDEF